MNQVKVYQFLEENQGFLFPNDEHSEEEIESLLVMAPDTFEWTLQNLPFRKPSTVQLIAFLVGSIGIDRFYLGDVKKGILKYFTFGGFGIWWIKDIFSAKKRCRAYNCEKLMAALEDPSVASQMQRTDNNIKVAIDGAKKIAPLVMGMAKDVQGVGKTFEVEAPEVVYVRRH